MDYDYDYDRLRLGSDRRHGGSNRSRWSATMADAMTDVTEQYFTIYTAVPPVQYHL